jgi:hypothetical protein
VVCVPFRRRACQRGRTGGGQAGRQGISRGDGPRPGWFQERASGPLNRLLALIYALLGIAVIIALLGIANTLALSISSGPARSGSPVPSA